MTEERPPARRRSTRDSAATIRRILVAAREEFSINGFDGTKIEHIARRANVSKQIIYFYFQGKEELYWELLKDITISVHERILDINFHELHPLAAIRKYIEGVYDAFVDDPMLGMVSLDQSIHDGAQLRSVNEIRKLQKTLVERIAAVVRRGQAEGVFHEDIDGDKVEFMTVIITVGCLSSSTMLERYSGRKWQQNSADTRSFALDFIMRALLK